MKPIQELILKSGLIDKHTAKMLEIWGNLPEGASDLVREDALKDANKEHLLRLAETIEEAVERRNAVRETQLDLNRLHWPVTVRLIVDSHGTEIASDVPAVIDRMGRFFFRIQDVRTEWFVPGRFILRASRDGVQKEEITEVSELYTDDKVIAVQVSVG